LFFLEKGRTSHVAEQAPILPDPGREEELPSSSIHIHFIT